MNIPSKFPWSMGVLPNGDRYIKCAEGKDVAYFPHHPCIHDGNRSAANLRYVLEASGKLADAQAEIARLRGALGAEYRRGYEQRDAEVRGALL